MKRRAIHLAFGAATFGFAGLALYDYAALRHAQDVSRAVREVIAATPAAQADASRQAGEAVEIRLARAVSLSKAGRSNDAQRLFDPLAAQTDDRTIQAAALFDLGNLYLREAAGADAAGPIRSPPLLEQAKERYRAALRIMPDDWDARYNLERALWLAPETPGDQEELDIRKKSTVKLRGAQSEDLP
jgi:mxaK protein